MTSSRVRALKLRGLGLWLRIKKPIAFALKALGLIAILVAIVLWASAIHWTLVIAVLGGVVLAAGSYVD